MVLTAGGEVGGEREAEAEGDGVEKGSSMYVVHLAAVPEVVR